MHILTGRCWVSIAAEVTGFGYRDYWWLQVVGVSYAFIESLVVVWLCLQHLSGKALVSFVTQDHHLCVARWLFLPSWAESFSCIPSIVWGGGSQPGPG